MGAIREQSQHHQYRQQPNKAQRSGRRSDIENRVGVASEKQAQHNSDNKQQRQSQASNKRPMSNFFSHQSGQLTS